MNKMILALTVLGSAAATVQAQSSVTVFGILDANVRSVKNGSVSATQLGNNGYSANQLGFRGVEDLGGGLSAGFWLEAALSPDVGTATTENGSTKFFQRRSTVSLSGGFGEVRLGRDLDPSYLNIAFEAFGNLGTGSALNLVSTLGSGATTLVRADNMIAYHLPGRLGGVYGSIAFAPGENVRGQKYSAARLGFNNGKVNVAAAFGRTDSPTADHYKLFNVGGSVDLGVVKVLAFYNQAKYGLRKQDIVSLGAHVPIGQLLIRASVLKANASGGGTDANDATLAAVGAVYFLSKRTQVYTTAARITNKGTAAFSVSGAAGVVPAVAATGRKSNGYEFGLRHSF